MIDAWGFDKSVFYLLYLNPVHNLIYMYIILDSYLEQESFFSRKFYRSSFITGWLSMTDDRDKKGLQIRIKKILYFVVNFGILFYFFEFYVIFYLNHHHYHIFFLWTWFKSYLFKLLWFLSWV